MELVTSDSEITKTRIIVK